jgi:alpha-tubulin suppressor-like RCC1 family protein
MGHSGELARSSSMGAPLLPSDSGIPQYDLGKTFIGEIYTTMEKNREGEMEEVENYRYHTDLINGKFLTPAPVEWDEPGDYHVLDMALGECHMVVVARKGNAGQTRVYSCGHNNYGQLGHGDRVQRHVLTPIKQLDCEGIVQVECGTFHTLFLAGMGKLVFACGRSDYGQLGLFDEKEKIAGGYQDTPVPVPFPKEIGNTRISFIAAGANNSACVADTGDVYAWGFNATASTGHPSKVRRGSDDMERVTKLNPMRYYKKTKGMAIMGTDATVSSLSLGGQHSLMVVQRFK